MKISDRRLRLLLIMLMFPVLVVLVRAAQVQLLEGPGLAAQAADQQSMTFVRKPPRGSIFDSAGNVLAVSTRAYNVKVITATMTDTTAAAVILSPVVLKPMEEIRQKIEGIMAAGRDLTRTTPVLTLLYHNLSPEATNRLTETLGGSVGHGLAVEPSWQRNYPQGLIAGPLLGFVSLEPKGYSGLEGYYDPQLDPAMEVRRERAPYELLYITPTNSGTNLVLALNMALQVYVEKRLAQAMQDYQPQGGSIIVMDSRTGAIIASASTPGYDPNAAFDIANSDDAKRLHDPAVSDLYEPGSVIKALTVAAALDHGTITTQTTYTDTGRFVVGGKTIYNSDRVGHGEVDIEGMLAESLNVVAAQISQDMGPDAFYHYFSLFGLGRRTGIDLENEASGILRTPTSSSDWSKADLATNSFGQGMSATPYQVLNAMNVIANDGLLMQPFVTRQGRTVDGAVVERRPTAIQRVLSPETALAVRTMMAHATRKATPAALVKGYTVAGKTGTADWYLRGVKQETTIATYVAFVPAYQPRLTILVKLDQPNKRWAAQTTVLVFHDVAERAVQILGIPPDNP